MKNLRKKPARFASQQFDLDLEVSRHANRRMKGRSIAREALEAVCAFGRDFLSYGCTVYRLVHRDVERAWREGIDLRAYEGINVVLAEARVVTVYRERRRPGHRGRGAGYDACAGRRPFRWPDHAE